MINKNYLHSFFITGAVLVSACLSSCNQDDKKPEDPPRISTAQQVVQQGLVGAIFSKLSTESTSFDSAGFTNQEQGIALQFTQYFALGSNGKSITAMLAAKMVEAGLVQWNSRIIDVLPELKDNIRAEYSEVTLEQLLDHRSGMIPLTSIEEAQNYDGDFPDDRWERRVHIIKWILSQKPVAASGTSFSYSNAGYTVAGAMLEKLGKDSYLNLANQWVLAPLGISAIMTMPATQLANQPLGYLGQKNHLTQVNPLDETLLRLDDAIAPAGSLCMTAQDYGKYLRWHLMALSGKNTPIPFSYIDKLQKMSDGEYKLGWGLIKNTQSNAAILLHLGETDGFTSLAILDQKGSLGVFALANTATDDDNQPWVASLLQNNALQLYVNAKH